MRSAVLGAVALLVLSCGGETPSQRAARRAAGPPVPKPLEATGAAAPVAPPIARDLPQIVDDQTLKVLFTFNSTGYFIYRGQTMGYEYELLSKFARDSGLHLEPVVIRDSKLLFERLNTGDGDVVAAQLAATPDESEVLMTQSLYSTA